MTCISASHFFYTKIKTDNKKNITHNRQPITEITSSGETDLQPALNVFDLNEHKPLL